MKGIYGIDGGHPNFPHINTKTYILHRSPNKKNLEAQYLFSLLSCFTYFPFVISYLTTVLRRTAELRVELHLFPVYSDFFLPCFET